jgi:hypothetical protein
MSVAAEWLAIGYIFDFNFGGWMSRQIFHDIPEPRQTNGAIVTKIGESRSFPDPSQLITYSFNRHYYIYIYIICIYISEVPKLL